MSTPTDRGVTPGNAEERAEALDLLAGEGGRLRHHRLHPPGQGDLAPALEILAPRLLPHPDSSELAELRQAVLVQLMVQRQLLDPFGFVAYAQVTRL
jgi:hypothetical protein